MLAYGKNVAIEILLNKNIIKNIYISNEFFDKEISNKLSNYNVIKKNKNELDKMVDNQSQGIIIDIKDYHFVDFNTIKEDNTSDFLVILDHIEDPHNFGAIIRTCEAAGVNYIIIPNKGNSDVNNTVLKTSCGALLNMKICKVANLRNAIEELKKVNYWIIGTDMEGTDYTKIDYKDKIALIIGNEGKGLKYIIKQSCDFIASIPMKGKINSLNASVSCGIMIYEILKSRGK